MCHQKNLFIIVWPTIQQQSKILLNPFSLLICTRNVNHYHFSTIQTRNLTAALQRTCRHPCACRSRTATATTLKRRHRRQHRLQRRLCHRRHWLPREFAAISRPLVFFFFKNAAPRCCSRADPRRPKSASRVSLPKRVPKFSPSSRPRPAPAHPSLPCLRLLPPRQRWF